MKFLIDLNLSPSWVPFLESQGFEAQHWSVIGKASAPDAELMTYAAAHGYIVFTHDLDFGMLLNVSGARGPSVIQVRAQDVLPSGIGEIVVRAIRTAEGQLTAGALVTVDLFKQRIRMLPI